MTRSFPTRRRGAEVLVSGLLMAITVAAPALPPESVRSPGTFGLEMRLTPVRSDGAALAAALAPFEREPTGIDEEASKRLRQSGLRAVAVPIGALEQALGSLTPAGAVQQEWLGTLTFWSPIVSGPPTDEPMTRLDSGEVNFGQGRFRLLARCWIVPDLTEAEDIGYARAKLRLELLPQHVPAQGRRLQRLLTPALNTPVAEGQVLPRLRLTCDLGPDRALVLVPIAPGQWASAPAANALPGTSDAPPGPDPDPEDPEPVPPVDPTVGLITTPARRRPPGPLFPAAATLGEHLLRWLGSAPSELSDRDATGTGSERSIVVVLIAHVPAQYRLLP
ncbi:MAG: hypothetical protein Kow0022_09200 [Phycisphaerales bacterium]